MNMTYNEFIQLCRSFEEQNSNLFAEENIRYFSFNQNCIFYDAIYKDEYNYSTFVRIFFEDSNITWETTWDDAHDAITELFTWLFPDKYSYSMSFIHYIPADDITRKFERAWSSGLV